MKKTQMKRTGVGFMKPKDPKKPFGFCCDVNNQDPDTLYDMRIPPFVTSLTNVAPNTDGPDLKFRIQDIARPMYPTLRSGTHKVKKSTHLGRCKRCRGPLRWYIEEEVALAREIVSREKAIKCKNEEKARALQKKHKRQSGKKKDRKKESKKTIEKVKKPEQEEENEDSEKDEDKI